MGKVTTKGSDRSDITCNKGKAMIRLRVREFVEAHTRKLTRYQLARDAGLSPAPLDKAWNEPENTEILLSTLEKIAHALSQHLGRYVSTKELYEDIPGNVPHAAQSIPPPITVTDEGEDSG